MKTIAALFACLFLIPQIANGQDSVWSRLADDDVSDWRQTWIIISLLGRPEVQQRLGLAEEQVDACNEIAKQGRKVFSSLTEVADRGGDLDQDGQRIATEYRSQMEAHLLPHQLRELLRFEFQFRLGKNPPGYGVLSLPVINKLNLSDAQKARLEVVDGEQKRKIDDEIAEFRKRLQKLKEEHRNALISELDEDQKKLLEDLIGTKMFLFNDDK